MKGSSIYALSVGGTSTRSRALVERGRLIFRSDMAMYTRLHELGLERFCFHTGMQRGNTSEKCYGWRMVPQFFFF